MAEPSKDAAAIGELVAVTFGQAPVSIERIAAGLGARRFYRVVLASAGSERATPATAIARVEPNEARTKSSAHAPESTIGPDLAWLPEPPLEPIRARLEQAGLPVPAAYGRSQEIDLIEDVGSETLLRRAHAAIAGGPDPASSERLRADYRAAADLIPCIQHVDAGSEPVEAFDRHYDDKLIFTKTEKFLRWCWPGLVGRDATPAEASAVHAMRDVLSVFLRGAPERLAHRDFKAENLHWCRGRFVMIDVQGAFMAPPEYDLACLVWDLQIDLPEDLIESVIAATLPRLPDRVPEAVARARMDALGILRLAKDVAHVVHAARSRGDWRRWHEIPRGLALLSAAARRQGPRFPELRALKSVIQTLSSGFEATDIGGSP